MGFGRHAGRVVADITPNNRGRLGKADRGKVQQQRETDRQAIRLGNAGMDVPGRVLQPRRLVLLGNLGAVLVIFINRLRDDFEMQPLRPARLRIHEQRQRFRAAIAKPLLDAETVTFGLGNFLAG